MRHSRGERKGQKGKEKLFAINRPRKSFSGSEKIRNVIRYLLRCCWLSWNCPRNVGDKNLFSRCRCRSSLHFSNKTIARIVVTMESEGKNCWLRGVRVEFGWGFVLKSNKNFKIILEIFDYLENKSFFYDFSINTKFYVTSPTFEYLNYHLLPSSRFI